MLYYIFIGCFCLLLAYIMPQKNIKYSLICLAVAYSFRYMYGNDYSAYFDYYNSIRKMSNIINVDMVSNKNVEKGWVALNYLFKIIFGQEGFFILVALETIAYSIVIDRLIIAFHVKDAMLSFLLLLLTPVCFLVQLSAMRQCLALVFVYLSIINLLKNKYLYCIVLILVGSLFHKSCVFCLIIPVIYLSKMKTTPIIVTTIAIIIFTQFGGKFIDNLIDYILTTDFDYKYYVNEDTMNTKTMGLGSYLAIGIDIYTLFILCKQKEDKIIRLLKHIMCYSMILYYVGTINSATSRLAIYFIIIKNIIVYPKAIEYLDRKGIKNMFSSILITLGLYNTFFIFFYHETFTKDYYTFKSIISYYIE